MAIPKLTLDTNLLIEYWRRRKKVDIIENLLELGKQGIVDLAVTARIREDIPLPTLSNNLNNLPELQITETGSIARWGYWLLDGRQMFGDEAFNDFLTTGVELAKKRGKTPPDWRDWDHLHAHYLLKRDIFLTWDDGIICLSKELKENFDINISSPDEYLRTFTINKSN